MTLETVITECNDVPPDGKGPNHTYNVRTYPNGLKFLMSRSFNLIARQ